MAKFQIGHRKLGGRQRGTRNKRTAAKHRAPLLTDAQIWEIAIRSAERNMAREQADFEKRERERSKLIAAIGTPEFERLLRVELEWDA